MTDENLYVAFEGVELLGRGPLPEVASICFHRDGGDPNQRIAVYEDQSGRVIDVDLSGSESEVLARLSNPPPVISKAGDEPAKVSGATALKRRGPGRPKLGVVSREVSLLPRHWSWLADQRGGASASLRRLVEQAKKNESPEALRRRVVDAAHRFLWDIAGDQPNFEELSRALYAGDLENVASCSAGWPKGIVEQLGRYLDRYRDVAS